MNRVKSFPLDVLDYLKASYEPGEAIDEGELVTRFWSISHNRLQGVLDSLRRENILRMSGFKYFLTRSHGSGGA